MQPISSIYSVVFTPLKQENTLQVFGFTKGRLTQRKPRLVGRMKAKELLLTGRNIDADEAISIGLVNMIVDDNKLMDTAYDLAGKIAKKSKVQTGFIKELVNKGTDIDLNSANSLEISYFSSGFSTNDQKEGMKAFLEKRKPNFKGK